MDGGASGRPAPGASGDKAGARAPDTTAGDARTPGRPVHGTRARRDARRRAAGPREIGAGTPRKQAPSSRTAADGDRRRSGRGGGGSGARRRAAAPAVPTKQGGGSPRQGARVEGGRGTTREVSPGGAAAARPGVMGAAETIAADRGHGQGGARAQERRGGAESGGRAGQTQGRRRAGTRNQTTIRRNKE